MHHNWLLIWQTCQTLMQNLPEVATHLSHCQKFFCSSALPVNVQALSDIGCANHVIWMWVLDTPIQYVMTELNVFQSRCLRTNRDNAGSQVARPCFKWDSPLMMWSPHVTGSACTAPKTWLDWTCSASQWPHCPRCSVFTSRLQRTWTTSNSGGRPGWWRQSRLQLRQWGQLTAIK